MVRATAPPAVTLEWKLIFFNAVKMKHYQLIKSAELLLPLLAAYASMETHARPN